MMGIAEVEEAIFRDLQLFRLPILFQRKGVLHERAIIALVKQREDGEYWRKGYAEINFCVPDIAEEPSKLELKELEQRGLSFFKHKPVFEYNGEYYQYSLVSHSVAKDEALLCHYVNFKVLITDLNVI